MDCRCRGPVRLGHDKHCERFNSLMRENGGNTVSEFEYDIARTVTTTTHYSKRELLLIFADFDSWSSDGRFNKINAIKMARVEFDLGLLDAKVLVEDFMVLVFGAKTTPFNN